ncbi:hypothetical protein BYT27DRAFT_7340404 [Phlegmacium glaucopus]|nr:hypothetical protein BYT27DRAFT_7340404 [Phlegmacium glaucopus]
MPARRHKKKHDSSAKCVWLSPPPLIVIDAYYFIANSLALGQAAITVVLSRNLTWTPTIHILRIDYSSAKMTLPPKTSIIGRKSNNPNKAPAYHRRNASIDSLSSAASLVGGSTLGSNSPSYTSPSSSTNSLSPSYSSPYGEYKSTTSTPLHT